MKISLVPVLSSLRSIYDVDGVQPRFDAYLSLMLDQQKPRLPLGAFSPMGKNQPAYLDALLDLDAESLAASACRDAEGRLSNVECCANKHCRIILVVVDAGSDYSWTDRYLTDAEWRFQEKYDQDFFRTVQLWTDESPPTKEYVTRETQAALYRAIHRQVYDNPVTLEDMMKQEGRSLCFANETLSMNQEDLLYSRTVLEPLLQSTDYPSCFAALYGDEAAISVGYPPLGLSHLAGFQVGLANAIEEQTNALQSCDLKTKAGCMQLLQALSQ